MVAMPKLVGEGFYVSTIRVEFEWKPSTCSSYEVFGQVLKECRKKVISEVVKNLKNSKQATRGVQVGPNVGFKPFKQVYRHVFNNNGARSSGKNVRIKSHLNVVRVNTAQLELLLLEVFVNAAA
nr:hypothetical protein [Tanacetum cinerariifolium]